MDLSHPSNPLRELDVLIVDDAATIRRTLRAHLEQASLADEQIREAESAREALASFEEEAPDLVFLDVVLPDIPGEELGATLMDLHPDTDFVPVTALDPDDGRVRQLVAKGAIDVVQKPLDGDKLQQLLEAL